jgi:DNA-binding transcriptional LysR family regulator
MRVNSNCEINNWKLMILIHRLEGFFRVARAEGYARAARAFPYPITQAGVHAQVRKLEQELGVRLLEQVAKDRLVPTRAGRKLLDFCAPFFEQLPEILEDVARGEGRGRIRIEAGALEIQEVVPDWLRRVQAEHPQLEIELREIDAPDPNRLLEGRVDLIVDYQASVPEGISTRRIGSHRSYLVVPSRHPLLRRGAPRVDRFLNEPFVALSATLPQSALQMDALRAIGAQPTRITHAPSITSVLAFVAAGLGYSLIPWPGKNGPHTRGVTTLMLRGKSTQFPIVASWRTTTEPDADLNAVLRLAPS